MADQISNLINLMDIAGSKKLTTTKAPKGSPKTFQPTFESCETHGKWQSSFDDGECIRWRTSCPKCERQAKAFKLLDRAGIPPRFKNKTFENFRTDEAGDKRNHEICSRYASNFKQVREKGICLIMIGGVGTGKTHLSCGIGNQIIQDGYGVVFTKATEMIKALRASWSKSSDKSEEKVIREFSEVDLLIIDEVGIQYGSDAEKIQVFEVINRRYEQVMPTIVISNLPITSGDDNNLTFYMGERCIDRLQENGGMTLTFNSSSKRGDNN